MKHTMLCFFLLLCFFGAGSLATPSGSKEDVGFNAVDTSVSRSFEMVNERGDSAACTITSKKAPLARKEHLDSGEMSRKNIFRNEQSYEKFIDRTNLGGNLPDYKNVKMVGCRLYRKGSLEAAKVAASDEEEETVPSAPAVGGNLKEKARARAAVLEAEQKTDVEEKANDDGAKDNFFSFTSEKILNGLFLFVIVVLIIILILRERGHRKQMITYTNNENEAQEILEGKSKEIIKLKSEVAELNAKVQRLQDEIEYLKRCLSAQVVGQYQQYAAPVPPPITTPTPSTPVASVARKEIFYFSNPTGNSFTESKSTPIFVDGKSLYCFERVERESVATVAVVNEPSVVQRFTYSPESQMGVCELVGAYNKNANAIETLEPGSAVLDDGKWTVKKKIKIRYK